jgi:hypothetical protein
MMQQTTLYNDCAANIESGGNNNDTDDNLQGVGSNSCCFERPKRVSEYPQDGSGLSGGGAAVCRNTYLEVNFDHEIDESSLNNNIFFFFDIIITSYKEPVELNTGMTNSFILFLKPSSKTYK